MRLKYPKKNLSKTTPSFNNIFPVEVVAFVSQRPDDFALAANQNDFTESQKQLLSKQLGFSLTKAASVRQVHGDRVIVVDKDSACKMDGLEEADGLVTKEPKLPLAIRTADCLPVFMYDARRRCIGLVHAGWQGSKKEIVARAVALMEQQGPSDPADITIGFGPSIRPCCYEVGEEFREHFSCGVIARGQRVYLDLVAINKHQLMKSGVLESHIFDCGLCTCCNQNFFSYRRQGASAGRLVSLMMLQ